MCSIMGYCDSEVNIETFKKGFCRTISRGPDDSRIIDTGKGLLGFHRLSIMGLTPSGMQPFELDGSYVVCNGELYGFEKERELLRKKGYSFRSDSDCEIILPMYFDGTAVLSSMLSLRVSSMTAEQVNTSLPAIPLAFAPLHGYVKGTILFAAKLRTS